MGDDSVNRSLYVGGITESITEELLYELFLQAGPLESVKIASERDGRKKNFAFVNFKHEVSVPFAIQLMAGIRLFGTPLRLQPRPGSIHQSQQRQNGPPLHMKPGQGHQQFQQGRAMMHRSMSAPSMDHFGRRKMNLPPPSGGPGSTPGTPDADMFPNLPPPPRDNRQDRDRGSHGSDRHRDRSSDRHRDSPSGDRHRDGSSDRHRDSRRDGQDDRYRDSPGSSPRHPGGQQGGWQMPQFAPHQINLELARQRMLAEQEQRRMFAQGQHGQYRDHSSDNQSGRYGGRRRR